MSVEYNDNIQLTPQSGQDSVGRYASAGARFYLARPEQEILFHPFIRAQRYSGAPLLDNDDYLLDVSASRQLERSTLSLRGNYYQDTTQTNDIGATGLIDIGVHRVRSGINPGWRLDLTPEAQLNLDLGYNKVAYAKHAALGATVDYDFASASMSYHRELAEGDELNVTLSADRLDAPEISNKTDHGSMQLDYATSPAERLRISTILGIQYSRFARGLDPVEEKSGALAGFTLVGEGEYRTIHLSLTRAIEPSGTGTLMQNDTLSLSLRAELRPDLTSTLSTLLSDRADLQGIDPSSDRVVGQMQIGLDWRLAEHWSCSTSYQFLRQREKTTDIEADSNSLMLSLSYTGEPAILTH